MAGEKSQNGPFRKKRAGVVLSREEVKEIKVGRKKLRKEMRSKGLKRKQDFEIVAGGLGLYFDKRSGLLAWMFHGRGLWALLASLLLLLGVFFLMSTISQMRGYFTISLRDNMFREGFLLSETADFANPVVNLYCEPATDVPCISIVQLNEEVDQGDGVHNDMFFAYTFYLRNEGENTVDYTWELQLNDESQQVSDAVWMMVFVDGRMRFYAKANGQTGQPEALPAFGDDSRGFIDRPLYDVAMDPDEQYQVIREKNGIAYHRLVPIPFESDRIAASGLQEAIAPMDTNKFTVVMWLEGDDPDCDNSKIGGHLGMDMQFVLVEDSIEAYSGETRSWWEKLWDSLNIP